MKSPQHTAPTDLVANEALHRPTPGSSPGSTGLIATYFGDNGIADIAVDNAPTVLVTVPGVAIAAGQKVIVHGSVWLTNIAGGGQGVIFLGISASSGGPFVPIDGAAESSNP